MANWGAPIPDDLDVTDWSAEFFACKACGSCVEIRTAPNQSSASVLNLTDTMVCECGQVGNWVKTSTVEQEA